MGWLKLSHLTEIFFYNFTNLIILDKVVDWSHILSESIINGNLYKGRDRDR